MDLTLKCELTEIYRRYGFDLAKSYERNQVLVFTIKNGYFDNADIVPLVPDVDTTAAFSEFSKTGYACTVRPLSSPAEAEKQLFKGFFSVESIVLRLQSEYEKFTKNIVSPFSDTAKYEYINAPYRINGKTGDLTPADEVINRLSSPKPTLFLVEAAAGFGKTCTAYELVNLLVNKSEYLPLFSELSRNRQAAIFRYILLDEIDRTFPVLSSRLVQAEMRNGRVVTILDGFDELLRKAEDSADFENREPMLETIGEFLTGNAKIVLTTRRTILFEGDAFHAWVEKHIDDFDLVRIRISEPRVENWLIEDRINKLQANEFEVAKLANPVLLSYLRCISDSEFEFVASEPQLLVETYFKFMLEREIRRQDLRINPDKQQEILGSIAQDMISFGYTSEQRDYIVDHILRSNSRLLDEALKSYPSSERPTKEGIANKLASHALLDRSTREPNKIGFINEFVFGHFVSRIILGDDDWLNDDLRFIEPAVVSFQPRSQSSKNHLWDRLKPSVEFLPVTDCVDISLRLNSGVPFELSNDEVVGLEFNNISVGYKSISNFQFNECVFRDCSFNVTSFDNVTFLNCRYFGNNLIGDKPKGQVYVLGAIGDQDFINQLSQVNSLVIDEVEPDRKLLVERFILEKFWPVGRETSTHKHRPIKGVCVNNGEFNNHELYAAISSLKRKGILREPMQSSFIEINLDEISAIREILGRSVSNGK